MKRILLIIACLFSSVFVFSQEMSNKDKWQIKTYREKYSYIEGFFDCGLNLGSAIENQIKTTYEIRRYCTEISCRCDRQ